MATSSKYAEWDTEYLIFNLIDEQHTNIKNKPWNIEEVAKSLKMKANPDFMNLLEFWSRLDLFLLKLQLHIIKEESSLYPDILRLSTIINFPEEFPDYKEKFVNYQVANLKLEHDTIKSDISYFNSIISNYSSKISDHLIKYISVQFRELELILIRHLNIEDRILYPRAIKLESDMNDEMKKIKPGCSNFRW